MNNIINTEYLSATTQHQDLSGAVAVDGWAMPPLNEIACAIGVDTNRYWPINLSVYASRMDEKDSLSVSVTIDAVDKSLAGESYDDLLKYIEQRGGKVQTIRFRRHEVDMTAILKLVRRLSIVLRRSDMNLVEIEARESATLSSDGGKQ